MIVKYPYEIITSTSIKASFGEFIGHLFRHKVNEVKKIQMKYEYIPIVGIREPLSVLSKIPFFLACYPIQIINYTILFTDHIS